MTSLEVVLAEPYWKKQKFKRAGDGGWEEKMKRDTTELMSETWELPTCAHGPHRYSKALRTAHSRLLAF